MNIVKLINRGVKPQNYYEAVYRFPQVEQLLDKMLCFQYKNRPSALEVMLGFRQVGEAMKD